MKVRSNDTQFPRMCIFPEGTTNNGGCVMQFKKGAFTPGQPVTPILLTYPNEYYNCACSGRNGSDMSLIRCIFQFHNRMKAVILDAYEPNEEEKADPEKYARNVRDYMAKELNLPTTEHSYPDMFLGMEGASWKEPYYFDATFEMCEVKKMYSMELDDCKLLLKRFAEIDKEKGGSISLESFKTLLHLQTAEEEHTRRLYSFFDTADNGAIEFKDFLEGVALVSSSSTVAEKTTLAFVFSDKQGVGSVTAQNINTAAEEAKKLGLIDEIAPYLVDDKAIDKFDKDKDGRLSLAEYEELVASKESIIEPAVEVIKSQFGVCFESIKKKVEEERDAKMTTGEI
jgi:lysophosphatidylcholine acyltransferase / lyso-PAF acetyltransferase